MRKLATAIFPLLVAAQFAMALPASAQSASTNLNDPLANLQATGVSSQNPRDAAQALPGIIGNLVKVALGLLGVIFLVLILYAGFTWMTAGGDSKKVDTAKGTLSRAITGLIIVTAAYALTSFVVRGILNATNPNAVP